MYFVAAVSNNEYRNISLINVPVDSCLLLPLPLPFPFPSLSLPLTFPFPSPSLLPIAHLVLVVQIKSGLIKRSINPYPLDKYIGQQH